jgi:hypothetical protein
MATSQGLRQHHAGLIGVALFIAAGALGTNAAGSARAPAEAYLDALQGTWVMEGTLGGRPVRYSADGQRVLRGAFVRLHMIDVASPPQYEAEIFIGFDPKANDYIAHWLDRFGAPGARVVARGATTTSDVKHVG